MPESVNGMAVAGMGHTEGKTGDRFLFTSESVGEGHPGMLYYLYWRRKSSLLTLYNVVISMKLKRF